MQKVSTPKAEIILLKENLAKIIINERAELDEEDMREINNAKLELVGNIKHGVLFIPGRYAVISNKARKFSASQEVQRYTIANAIIMLNLAHRLIANFFMKADKPRSPVRLFSSEEEALKWLEKMMS